jgi:hypothetical protein
MSKQQTADSNQPEKKLCSWPLIPNYFLAVYCLLFADY